VLSGSSNHKQQFDGICSRTRCTARARPWPNWETNEARGGGSSTGAGRSESGAPHDVTSGLVRLIGGTLYRLGRPRIPHAWLSSPSVPHHLYRGPKSRGRNLKAPPAPIAGSALGPQNGGPNWETNEARGGGSCTFRWQLICRPLQEIPEISAQICKPCALA
jgi:hypothetical protein